MSYYNKACSVQGGEVCGGGAEIRFGEGGGVGLESSRGSVGRCWRVMNVVTAFESHAGPAKFL